MSEATDLGVRLVQANARSVWATYAPIWAVVTLIALAFGSVATWLPSVIIFCMKPWLDRTLLFVLSRAVFGTQTRLRDVWAAQASVWWKQLFFSLTTRRLSPWRAYTLPVLAARGSTRCRVARQTQAADARQAGCCACMHGAFAQLESLLLIGALSLALWFAPESSPGTVFETMVSGDTPFISLLIAATYAGIVLLVEPFYVGAGFAMYLNRRVELEAWDIEQSFALRSAADFAHRTLLVTCVAATFCAALPVQAEGQDTASIEQVNQVVNRMKADPAPEQQTHRSMSCAGRIAARKKPSPTRLRRIGWCSSRAGCPTPRVA